MKLGAFVFALIVIATACANGQIDFPDDDAGGTITDGGTGADACASCMPGELCSKGMCVKNCTSAQLKCGVTCVDPKTDNANCGTCNKPCAMGYQCTNGVCEFSCAMGQKACGSSDDAGADAGPKCVDTTKDSNNCGMCGNVCMNMVDHGQPGCVNGQCGIGSCDMNYADCNMMAGDGCEADLLTDANNCTKCGMKCPMNLPVCSQGTCKATSCGNGQLDMGERCDVNNCAICAGMTVACFPSGNKNECKWDFSKVTQLYCNGGCSWAGGSDCDQADADIYCKLVKADPNSKATSFSVKTALAAPGFPCQPIGTYGTALGPISEYGVNLNNNGGVRYQDSSILANHGAGNVVTNVTCQ